MHGNRFHSLIALALCSTAGVALMRYDELGNAIPETDQDREFLRSQEARTQAAIAVATDDGGVRMNGTATEVVAAVDPIDPADWRKFPVREWRPEALEAWVAEINRRVGL